jgi:hypothetical protein
MNKPVQDIANMNYLLKVVRAGLIRFVTEGVDSWSKDGFRQLFKDAVDLDHPHIVATLKEWEEEGLIRIIGREDLYIEVLRINT